MQDDKVKKKKNKQQLVFKPYKKGNWHSAAAAKRGLRILLYYLVFIFMNVILGSALQFENTVLRVTLNLLLVLAYATLLYMDGARLGESEVALGEITYAREQAGKAVDPKDLDNCFHSLKGVFICLVGVLVPLLLAVPHAFLAEKQVYALQSLPSWVNGYAGHDEIALPLQYYAQEYSFRLEDFLRMAVRMVIFPFANIATTDNADALLLVDRLSPLLICLPALGFPLGYLTGPRSRALVHGDIATSTKRYDRRRNKAIKARKARTEKKNELI